MPTQDTINIKEKILSLLRKRGPSLPVHIANETNQSILFASAFLSELISERKIKTSYMRVGSSPLYLLPNQDHMLEKFADHLKSKEKDAFLLLKEKKVLADLNQDPAIRVALRQIRDFAIPFKRDNEIFFRYFKHPQAELKIPEIKEPKKDIVIKPIVKEPVISSQGGRAPLSGGREGTSKTDKEKPKNLEIFDKPKKQTTPKKKAVKRKTTTNKKTEKFFNSVKQFLSSKNIEILDIESFNKNDLILRVHSAGEEKLLIAFNKKRIAELDITKASKKAQELNLPYIVLSKGGPLKKLENLINAVKMLEGIEKV